MADRFTCTSAKEAYYARRAPGWNSAVSLQVAMLGKPPWDQPMMRQAVQSLTIATEGQGLYDFTREVGGWVDRQGMDTGLLTLFCRHTSASLLIQENADPDVRTDLQRYFAMVAPESATRYTHNDEGPDDMPAHLRTALTQTHLSVPLVGGRLALGTWQGIYLFEHRSAAHRRAVVLHLIGA